MASNYTLASIDELNPDEIASLGPADLAAFDQQLIEAALLLQRRADKLVAGLDARYAGVLQVERDRTSKEFGKVSVFDGEYQIENTLKKRVVWDQDGLAGLAARIKAAGDNPDVYITSETKTELKVSETAYEKWPAEVKAAFEPYRTVKLAGTPTWHVAAKL